MAYVVRFVCTIGHTQIFPAVDCGCGISLEMMIHKVFVAPSLKRARDVLQKLQQSHPTFFFFFFLGTPIT